MTLEELVDQAPNLVGGEIGEDGAQDRGVNLGQSLLGLEIIRVTQQALEKVGCDFLFRHLASRVGPGIVRVYR
jgi:hypothetical protein